MSITEPVAAINLDFKQQQLLINYFRSLPEKPTCTIRFFNHGDFYVLHEDDAELASKFTGNIIKFMGDGSKLSYVVVKKSQFEQFIRELLLIRQYRVEVYVKTAPNRINDWNIEYKGSPGNLAQFEEILFENVPINFNNYVMGVKLAKNKVIAVACINSTELKFHICEFVDNECFTELEALIAQIGPRECIIPQGDTQDLVRLRKVLERNGVLVAKVKRNDFNSSDDVIQDLNRLLYFDETQQRNANTLAETKFEEALCSLQAVIRFLNLTNDEQHFNQFKISCLDVHRFVRLDNAAIYSLDILPQSGSSAMADSILLPNSIKSFTLLGILDSCVTSQGRRLLEQWIKQPLRDYNLINERLDAVEYFVKDAKTRQLLVSDSLTRLPDLLLLSRKLSTKKATLQDCYRVYQIISSIPHLLKVLRQTNNKCIQSMLIDPICEIFSDLERYQNMIEEVLDLDLVDKGEFFVKHSFNSELDEIYSRKQQIDEKIQKLRKYVADDLGLEMEKTLKLETTDQHGYFFRVTLKEEQVLRQSKQYEILGAIKGGVRFTNSKLIDFNQDYIDVKKEYEEAQKSIILNVFEVAAGYCDVLRNLNLSIATVDVLTSFATTSVNARIPYVRPRLHKEGSGIFKLDKVRHPCIEHQDNVNFIPNSIEFGRNGKLLHIITGPNMCGKSTFIRSIGICVFMAHIGCLVPCEYAEISLVDAILTRIGAEDCQMKGLSTFMMEMIETSTICKSATSNSLVIIDELGRGTSTYDGCGIAWAIAEYLAKEIKCYSLFATHYHEITKLEDMLDCVNNLHVTAVTTDEAITPLFQIRKGQCDHSYGIHCARMAEFPDDVIQWAVEHQKRLEHSAGMQYINEFEPSIKKKVIEQGDKMIKGVLNRLKELVSQNASDETLKNEIQKIKTQFENGDNLFIKGLIQSS